MTTSRTTRRLLALAATGALVLAACGDDDDDGGDDGADATEPADAGATTVAATDAPSDTTGGDGGAGAGALADVCPSPLVIQTDWFPESEHGALYQLVGADPEIDTANKVVTGPLVASGGVDTGIEIEIRAGGPAIGFSAVNAQMYTDDSIHLGYVSTDGAALSYDDTPTIAVVAPLEKNPQIIQWDPETYPDVATIADLGELGVTINVFAGGTFSEVFVNEGVLSADQIDPSYDGSPARFISEGGAIAQQGFASESPYSYEVVYEEWAKPIAYELIHDAGLELYSQPLAVRTGDLETLRPCLEQVVPIVQQAVVDFIADPSTANALIVDVVEAFADFWVYPAELAQFSVDTQVELGLVGNGPDATVGNFDEARVQGVIDQMAAAGMDVPAELGATDLVTNEFIDPAIGL
jgi:hypothetical protein